MKGSTRCAYSWPILSSYRITVCGLRFCGVPGSDETRTGPIKPRSRMEGTVGRGDEAPSKAGIPDGWLAPIPARCQSIQDISPARGFNVAAAVPNFTFPPHLHLGVHTKRSEEQDGKKVLTH